MRKKLHEKFTGFATIVSNAIANPATFITAVFLVLFWALSGPIFGFSEAWQLIINTTTTIITFLTVFLIQNTQNRNDTATQLKLDEIIHSIKEARNEFIDIEDLTDEELEKLREEYRKYKNNKPKILKKKKK